ncbi:hypothetical protein C7N43_18295 [Sphingobacteriales bacterium UPWRP_1]|nr:hypothetical protein B6N25_02340 [Sphingobacteriales bacterium TSM_CSS]PSJ75583.1 hypothetical protein C7N43_18295 [Sphingobacteriales bacterium UPWRP_1]
MLILIVLLTISAIIIGVQRTLYRKQQEAELAFNQLSSLVGNLSDVAGKTIETLRRLEGEDKEVFTRLNQLRWQTTSRKLTDDKKTQTLNELMLLYNHACRQTAPNNPQLEELHQHWQQLLHRLSAEIEPYNVAATDFNHTIGRFPFNRFAWLLGYRKKTPLHIPKS